MKRIYIILMSMMLVVMASDQTIYKNNGDARLAPRLLNYQGYVTDALGNPITNPSISMSFAIFDAVSGGNQKWSESQASVSVDKGIFNVLLGSVTPIPDSVFLNSTNRWLQLTVAGQILSPRTRIASAAYSYTSTYSDTAQYARGAAADNDWYFRITDTADTTLQTGSRWGLARAGNVLYGNADSTQVNFGIACTTGMSGQNYKYCTVGGGQYNIAGNACATVAGGLGNSASDPYATVSGGYRNRASGSYATVGGGIYDTVSGDYATVSGGVLNSAQGNYTTVTGGYNNTANNNYATVAGGYNNTADGFCALVGCGYSNTANNTYTTVAGGWNNTASGYIATVGGGNGDTAKAVYSGVFSGFRNVAGDSTIDTAAVVCGGRDNDVFGKFSCVGGGYFNTAIGGYITVAGGSDNTASNTYTTIGGGRSNLANGYIATVAGGTNNNASGSAATVAGGYYDTSAALYSFSTGNNSTVLSGDDNSVAFNGQTTTASGQTRVGALSKASGTFTIDHPLDPENKILNHYFVESPEMVLIYRGSAVIGADGKAVVHLPDYFDALNEAPMIQLTGIKSNDVWVEEEVAQNTFMIGGKPGIKVYWTVTGARKDPSAEITKIIMPVEQPKEGGLIGRSLDDEFLVTTMAQLERMGKASGFKFRHASEQNRYEEMKQLIKESGK